MKGQILVVAEQDNSEKYSRAILDAGYYPMSAFAVCSSLYGRSEIDQEMIFEGQAKGTPELYEALVVGPEAEWAIPLFVMAGWGGKEHPVIGIGEEVGRQDRHSKVGVFKVVIEYIRNIHRLNIQFGQYLVRK